jgi:hypothetical protein
LRKTGLPLACLAVTISILLAGLWPFKFHPQNEVAWLNGQNGIHFGRLGIAYSQEAVYGPRGAIRPGGPVSIELAVRPGRELNHLARILTLYGGGSRQYFTLGQWKSYVILRAASRGNDLRSDFREMSARGILLENIPRFLTVMSRNGYTAIYADGIKVKEARNFSILPADSSASGKFVLGNSPTGNGSWTGELLFLSCYDRELPAEEVLQHFQDWLAHGTPTWSSGNTPALLYRFDERQGATSRNLAGGRYDISIPPTFQVLKKTVLRPPWEEEYFRRASIRDVVINVLGFIPFGFFFASWFGSLDRLRSKSNLFLVATLGGMISLAIELLQIYLPSRTSSFSDVVCNLSGTILGAYVCRWNLFSPPRKIENNA